LDGVTVKWDLNCITWEDEVGDFFAYERIGILVSELNEAFPIRSDIETAGTRTPTVPHSDDAVVLPEGLTYSTGAPGRRTSVHLVEPEMIRRFEAREQARSLRAEAEHLSEWLRAAHPQAAPMKPKTVQNRFAALYRRLTAEIPK
jgi:hypothetical protein